MSKQEIIELVAVGHVTIDVVAGESRLGGAASYAALTARRLGVNACMITSAGVDFPFWSYFDGITTKTLPSERTTVLEHHFVDGERLQTVRGLAAPIDAVDISGVSGVSLADDACVLYCPVVQEVEVPLIALAPNGLCAVAPQGFFRRWDDTGRIRVGEWGDAGDALASVDVVCVSDADAHQLDELARRFTGTAFVITMGERGCRVYAGSGVVHFPAPPANVVDATGAGDVFATALVVALRRGENVSDAVRFASSEAAACAEAVGVEGLL